MKFKSANTKKPWEKIELDKIQPYPSKYNKVIVTAYLFVFSLLFIKFMSVNSIFEVGIPFIKFAVYGTFAFVILKIVLKNANLSVSGFILFIIPIYTIFIIIINFLIFLVEGIPFSNIFTLLNPSTAIYAIIVYFYILFSLIGWGTVPYFFMSEHPKIKRHGYILSILFIFYFISGPLLQI